MSRNAQIWFRSLRIGLSPLEKIVGQELAYRAEDDTHLAWPTVARLADDTEVPRRTVARALASLEKRKIIERTGVKKPNGAVEYKLPVVLKIEATPPDANMADANVAEPVCQSGTAKNAKMAERTNAKMADTSFTIEQASQNKASQPVTTRDDKGTRLPEDWKPSDEELSYARSCGLPAERVSEDYRDYWIARPGVAGRKLNWPATWRVWCRKAADRGDYRQGRRLSGQKPESNLRANLRQMGLVGGDEDEGTVIDHVE